MGRRTPAAPGDRRRRSGRVPLDATVLYRPNGDARTGRVLNLGAGGMALRPEGPLDPDRIVVLEFRLPDETEPVRAAGRVVWSQGGEEPVCGIEFVQMPGATQEQILDYIERILAAAVQVADVIQWEEGAAMAQDGYRTEQDSMGEMRVPADAYYGASTARAVENFPISGQRFPPGFIRALGAIKFCAATVNEGLGLLDGKLAGAVREAAREVMEGKLDEHFPLDIFQTGSGTSTNMNANEVIANRATELLGGARGSRLVHPNDHVNMGQSSNDVIPTAIHVAALEAIAKELVPALRKLHAALKEKATAFDKIVKIGRTHLQDATPVRLGQEFGGYARQMELAVRRIWATYRPLGEVALGGTAVGTGINAHPEFARRACWELSKLTGLSFFEAVNHFEAQGAQDALVEASGALKTVAVSLTRIANDIRWLGSGPRCGLGEIILPAVQPGSSIMPGKVNPVIAEALIMACAQVIGNDAAITLGGLGSTLELNLMMPLMARNLLESVHLLARAADNFAERCVAGIQADEARCNGMIEGSLAMCTALVPAIGYDAAARIAKKAYETGKTVRQVALEEKVLPEAKLKELLDPWSMTLPGVSAKAEG